MAQVVESGLKHGHCLTQRPSSDDSQWPSEALIPCLLSFHSSVFPPPLPDPPPTGTPTKQRPTLPGRCTPWVCATGAASVCSDPTHPSELEGGAVMHPYEASLLCVCEEDELPTLNLAQC